MNLRQLYDLLTDYDDDTTIFLMTDQGVALPLHSYRLGTTKSGPNGDYFTTSSYIEHEGADKLGILLQPKEGEVFPL